MDNTTIPLTKGYFAKIDPQDYTELSKHSWYFHKGHAARRETVGYSKSRILLMHRYIITAKKGSIVDHINGDGLDNRRSNLRTVNFHQSIWNRGLNKNNNSGFKGVSWDKLAKRWIVKIMCRRKIVYNKVFKDLLEAARAYKVASIKYHGEYRRVGGLYR